MLGVTEGAGARPGRMLEPEGVPRDHRGGE